MKSSSSALDRILLSSSITGAAFFCGFAIIFFSAAGLLASAAGLFASTTGLFVSVTGLFSFSFFSAGRCTGAAFFTVSVGFSATTAGFASASLVASGLAFSTSFFSAASAPLRGRPTLRLGAAVFSALASTAGVSFSLFALTSLEGCCVLAGAASLFFATSPLFVAETALSSFLAGVTRGERFFLSSLRSSLSLSAATFLVAPTMACSSSIL